MRSLPAALVLALAACASAPPAVENSPAILFADHAFAPRSAPEARDVLAASDAMRRYLETTLARESRQDGKLLALVGALRSNAKLKLQYDASVTRTAAEAFEARAGNCLSLTVMTAALARELGLSVSFQRVLVDPLWTRSADLLFANGHINLLLRSPVAEERSVRHSAGGIVVDFMPDADVRRQRSLEIGEPTVIAMYRNNRAAETMREGRLDESYWWARSAVQQDPRFLEGINTLGVIYLRRDMPAQAERVFRHVLAQESENVSAMANLILALERLGRRSEALALQQRLRGIEASPPFHFHDLGMAALQRGEYASARDLFLRELRRNAFYHGAHFGLAIAYLGLGEPEKARSHLVSAQEMSTNRGEQDLYAAKLAWVETQSARGKR